MITEYKYLRPNKAEQLKTFYENSMVCRASLNAETHEKATILPLRKDDNHILGWGLGGVIDSNNDYISSSAVNGLYDYGYIIGEAEVKHEEVVYCGYFRKHWGHFLADCTNRLWYYLEYPNAKYIYFVEEGENIDISGNYREFFELLGIWDNLEIINHPTKYDKVIIPESGFDRHTNSFSNQYLEVFNRVAAKAEKKVRLNSTQFNSNVFFTRINLPKAQNMELGLPLIDSYFSRNGYQIISPEKIKLAEMIVRIRHANTIATYSGTLPHNMLFGKDHQKVVIIERNALNNRYQSFIGQLRDLHTIHIDANLCIYPVELAYGPFIYDYSKYLREFTEDNQYSEPDSFFLTEKYHKQIFFRYIEAYKKEHYLKWYMGGTVSWMTKDISLLYEAYKDSEYVFEPWISGKRLFTWRQLFDIHFFKIFVRQVIRLK